MNRILVVEDEANIALGLQDDLTLEGYEVAVARDGEEAIRLARGEAFDLPARGRGRSFGLFGHPATAPPRRDHRRG